MMGGSLDSPVGAHQTARPPTQGYGTFDNPRFVKV